MTNRKHEREFYASLLSDTKIESNIESLSIKSPPQSTATDTEENAVMMAALYFLRTKGYQLKKCVKDMGSRKGKEYFFLTRKDLLLSVV